MRDARPDGAQWFFNALTRDMVWEQPPNTLLCGSCGAAFATIACPECTWHLYCNSCFYGYHENGQHEEGIIEVKGGASVTRCSICKVKQAEYRCDDCEYPIVVCEDDWAIIHDDPSTW